MKFRTVFDRGETTYSPIGSEFAPTYSYRIDKKTGKKILVETGKTNIYEKIQASLESTKIENIIKRATADPNALLIKDGEYIDVSELPTSMIEIQNMMYKAKEEFNKLPSEIRSKFDNSMEKYISEYGSESWAAALGLKKEEPVTPEVKEEVKADE